MNRQGRSGLLMAVAIALVIGLIVAIAPSMNTLRRGTTYGRSPADYGAWYDYLEAQGAVVQRWRRPVADLVDQLADQADPETPLPTLIQIYPSLQSAWRHVQGTEWTAAGYRLIVLGVRTPVTQADFTATLRSTTPELATIRVQTRRRATALTAADRQVPLLADSYGAVAWQEPSGDRGGQVTLINTPTLAANAYQDYPDNFAFLAAIAQQTGGPIWIDEYLHGYRDQTAASPAADPTPQSWLGYLARTPFLLVGLQAGLITLLAIVALNRRFGRAIAWRHPPRNNSAEYIEALAQVLRKADSLEFVRDGVGQAERRQLQQALGLGQQPVDDATLQRAWSQQTGRPAAELADYFRPPVTGRLTEATLMQWISALQQARQRLS